ASATETVCALGFEEQLVGRSHECDYPPSVLRLPVCTEPKFAVEGSSYQIDHRVKALLQESLSVYRVHADDLKALAPTPIGAATDRPRVACVEWIEPLMASGNWMPQLVEMAGGVNLFGEAGQHAPWLTWEALCQADPDAILVLPCGFDIPRTRQEMPALMRR